MLAEGISPNADYHIVVPLQAMVSEIAPSLHRRVLHMYSPSLPLFVRARPSPITLYDPLHPPAHLQDSTPP